MQKPYVRAVTFLFIAGLFLAGCKESSQPAVEVRIPLADATPTLKQATVFVDYAKSGARPQIAGGTPSCTSILPHVSCRFSDEDGKLKIEAESPQGFSGPVDLAVCRMIPDAPGTNAAAISGRLRVEIADARGTDGQPIADTKVASKREAPAPSGAAATAGGEPGREGGGRRRPGADSEEAAAGAASAGTPGTAGQQGMVVTQQDLAAREQRRAEEQMKAREAQKQRDVLAGGQAATGVAPGGSATGAITGGEEQLPLGEEPGTGVNDATDDDTRATEYGVRFELASTSVPLGALQFDVKYHGGSGGWLGAGGGAACTWLVSAAIHACNDKRGGDLTCALVDTNGISGPTALMECTFKSRNSVDTGSFSVNVTDASSPSLEPANARVFVSGVYAR